MSEYKIFLAGTLGAGKTTAIGAISETPPAATAIGSNAPSHAPKPATMDTNFGQITLDNGGRIRMIGAPEHSLVKHPWKALSKNALGTTTRAPTRWLTCAHICSVLPPIWTACPVPSASAV